MIFYDDDCDAPIAAVDVVPLEYLISKYLLMLLFWSPSSSISIWVHLLHDLEMELLET